MTATSSKPCRLLIADDQPQILEALELLLEPEGFDLLRAAAMSPVDSTDLVSKLASQIK